MILPKPMDPMLTALLALVTLKIVLRMLFRSGVDLRASRNMPMKALRWFKCRLLTTDLLQRLPKLPAELVMVNGHGQVGGLDGVVHARGHHGPS